jgi:prepilin-type N-terminal cleavage/methylation domain-containing protein
MTGNVRPQLGPTPVETALTVACMTRRAETQRRSDVRERQFEHGFTLIELLLAIVLVGILSVVAIVGLSGLTKTGNNSACSTLVGAATSAAATYYANTGAYPITTGSTNGFDLLVQGTPKLLTLPSPAVTESGSVMKSGSSWSVTMGGGGGSTPNTFTKTGGGVACS